MHDRPVTVDEVTGRGVEARVLMVKDNKYCYDKMRVGMTDGKRGFFCLNAMCVFYQIPHSLKGCMKKVKRLNSGSERKKRKKKFSSCSHRALS